MEIKYNKNIKPKTLFLSIFLLSLLLGLYFYFFQKNQVMFYILYPFFENF